MMWEVHAILLPIFVVMGLMVGSFVNVCVYRIPWQKSVVWPPSCCPRCLQSIAPGDNVPLLGWLRLRGACRSCGLPISPRYPLVELLVGVLFGLVYWSNLIDIQGAAYSDVLTLGLVRSAYQVALVTFLVIATFIDFDYYIIPDNVTLPGTLVGLAFAMAWPQVRMDPASASTPLAALGVGVLGAMVGAGIVVAIRLTWLVLFRREAMGLGDATLMALIGAFLGWQAMFPVLFLAAFLGLAHSAWKLFRSLAKILRRRSLTLADREIPFGPYLSLAAVLLMLFWRRAWNGYLGEYYETLADVALLLGGAG